MTHLIFWNPDISSMTRERMSCEMREAVEENMYFNWSFWEHGNVHPGDTCYLVRCGDSTGPHGLMLRARITSEPYVSEDWSGRKRRIYYADWIPESFIDTEVCMPISPGALTDAMPDVNWFGGHSGRPLQDEYVDVLDRMWTEHLLSMKSEIGRGLYLNTHAAYLTPIGRQILALLKNR